MRVEEVAAADERVRLRVVVQLPATAGEEGGDGPAGWLSAEVRYLMISARVEQPSSVASD